MALPIQERNENATLESQGKLQRLLNSPVNPLFKTEPTDVGVIYDIVTKCIVPAAIGYVCLILGAEIGGLAKGYPGAGREIHERVVKGIKNIIFKENKSGRHK